MMNPHENNAPRPDSETPATKVYEHPQVKDLGSLKELTLSGTTPLSDALVGGTGGS